MIVSVKNNQLILLRRLTTSDLDELCRYLQELSSNTKSRFGPHPFDKQSIIDFYKAPAHWGYVAYSQATATIFAYAVIKMGYLQHDSSGLQSYGLVLSYNTDCTFAPSVADALQGCGIGNNLFQFILSDLKSTSINRLILWGGVQTNNDKAVNYYKRNGFKTLGQFNHNRTNYDMIFDII